MVRKETLNGKVVRFITIFFSYGMLFGIAEPVGLVQPLLSGLRQRAQVGD